MIKSRPLLVIGMGRSGTSVIAACLRGLGFYSGEDADFVDPDHGNVDGYYELEEINSLNERIRDTLGMRHDICRGCPEDWLQYEGMASLADELRAVLTKKFSSSPVWSIKDPRITLLLPVYEYAIGKLDLELSLAICVRNPIDSARSFSKRFNVPLPWAKAMWLQHTLTALRASIDHPSRVVCYETLLSDPRKALQPVVEMFPALSPTEAQWSEVIDLVRTDSLSRSAGIDEVEALRPKAFSRAFHLGVRMAADATSVDAGGFKEEILDRWSEFSDWWQLPPYDVVWSAMLKLKTMEKGKPVISGAWYDVAMKPQRVEVTFDMPTSGFVEGQLSEWVGQFLIYKSELGPVGGDSQPLALTRLPDIDVTAHPSGQVWNVRRAGPHFCFAAPAGRHVFSIVLACISGPQQSVKVAGENWEECLALRERFLKQDFRKGPARKM